MQKFGNIDPIGVWHGEIVEGHGRYMAAKELGLDKVPIIRLDDLTDEQRRAYGLVHNQLTMNSPFNLDSLKVELDNIADIDLSGMGFDLTLHDEYTDGPTQSIDGGGEINIDDFSDNKFSCTCPKCGFKFNPKEN
jgi:ParB-like chromosome segregation protein Spo0J